MTKISGRILHFETERRYLSENPYNQELYGEKKAGNAAESDVIYFVDSSALSFEHRHIYRKLDVQLRCATHGSV